MKKRAKICFYIFVVCAFFALGILGYFVLNPHSDNVMVGSKKFVTFTDTSNATSYSVSVNNLDSPANEHTAKYTFEKTDKSKNEFVYELEVNINGLKVATERYTQQIVSNYEDLIDCYIKNYEVTFFDTHGEIVKSLNFEDQFLKGVNKDVKCFTISEYFDELFVEDGKYHIECIPLNSEGQVIEGQKIEFDYDYVAYYKDDFARRKEFFINGVWCDYIIESKEEFQLLVWHSILFRNNNVSFYVFTNEITENNINHFAIDAINEYPEYNGLEENSTYAKMTNNVGTLVNFEFYLDFDFIKTYEDLQDLDEVAYEKALKELHRKDSNFNVEYITSQTSDNNRSLAIDSKENEVLVHNTEQLFMVVQYGAKPIFEDKPSAAKTVYENAKSELKKINNSNELSDFDKALNIYRYLCENVVYDYVTYEYMKVKNDFTINSFGNYNCFYLEGVFLDLENQYAVCDGLAKAYTLLCQMEGIDCVKINGEIVGQGNHAWNKVKIENEATSQKEWAYVDTTWGVVAYSQVNEEKSDDSETIYDNFEVLSHTCFLTSEDESKLINFEAGVDDEVGNFEYYKYVRYSFIDTDLQTYSGDYYLDSDQELKQIFNYAKSVLSSQKILNPLGEASTIIEVKFDKDYLGQQGSKIKEFMYLNKLDNSYQIKQWFNFMGITDSVGADWFILDDVVLFRFYM